MAKINTEKPSRKRNEKKISPMVVNSPKNVGKEKTEEKKMELVETKRLEEKGKMEKEKVEEKKTEIKEKDSKKAESKPKIVKPKKMEAVVNVKNVPISKKHSMAICDFIRKKNIDKAIEELEQVMIFKRAIPMKGEIPHRKGKGMMSGRFPVKSVGNFLVLLKSLAGNATYNSIEEPVIVEAVANMGVRPHGRFGRVRKKSTHVTLVAKSQTKKNSGGKK
jgi:ribosomal protein L22